MTLTKAMKDEIIRKLLNKAIPMEGLEKLENDLKDALDETGTCPEWDAARKTVIAYPEFCGKTKQVSLDYVFRSEYKWRNEAVRIELDTPYALEVEENRYARGALAFSMDKDGAVDNSYGITFSDRINGLVREIYAWARKRDSMEKDLEALTASISSSTKLIREIPETKEIIEASVEGKKAEVEAARKKKEKEAEEVLAFITEVFQKGGAV